MPEQNYKNFQITTMLFRLEGRQTKILCSRIVKKQLNIN